MIPIEHTHTHTRRQIWAAKEILGKTTTSILAQFAMYLCHYEFCHHKIETNPFKVPLVSIGQGGRAIWRGVWGCFVDCLLFYLDRNTTHSHDREHTSPTTLDAINRCLIRAREREKYCIDKEKGDIECLN